MPHLRQQIADRPLGLSQEPPSLHHEQVVASTMRPLAQLPEPPLCGRREVQFLVKIDRRGPDECWPWIGKRDRFGYGVFARYGSVPNHYLRSHRVALGLSLGVTIIGGVVMHSCDNPPCCNPAHLKHGTQSENTNDAARKGKYSGLIVGSPRWIAKQRRLGLWPDRRKDRRVHLVVLPYLEYERVQRALGPGYQVSPRNQDAGGTNDPLVQRPGSCEVISERELKADDGLLGLAFLQLLDQRGLVKGGGHRG